VSPASLTFPAQTTGTVSAGQVVTVSNTGDAPLSVTGVSINGAGAGDFVVAVGTDECTGGVVAPNGSCTMQVTFGPSTTGEFSADLVITHNAGAPSVVGMTGTGQAPAPLGPVALLPASVDFGAVRVGRPSTIRIALTNQGPGTLTVTGATTSGAPFTVNATACASLAVGRRCNIAVTFSPTAVGPVSGTLTVFSNARNSPTSVVLTGSGR
jgi:hypothetical protein